jgi:hypothetical protein
VALSDVEFPREFAFLRQELFSIFNKKISRTAHCRRCSALEPDASGLNLSFDTLPI